MNNRRTQLYLFLAQCLFTVFLYGSFTNWFRYKMDLRIFLLIEYLAAAVILLIPTHITGLIFSAKKKNPTLINVTNLSLTIVLIVATLGIHKAQYGVFLSLAHIVKTSPRSFTNHDGEEMQYWVEFKNPYHETHTEYLILTQGDEQSRIQIVAKTGKGLTYGTHSQRIELYDSSYLLVTKFEPWLDRYFLIDPESMTVISTWGKNPKKKSN